MRSTANLKNCGIVDAVVVNSYIIFKNIAQLSTYKLKAFRTSVALGLMKTEHKSNPKLSVTTVNNFKTAVPYEIRYDQCLLIPVHSNSRRYAFCSTTQKSHRTRWMCNTCIVGLCLNDKRTAFYYITKNNRCQ